MADPQEPAAPDLGVALYYAVFPDAATAESIARTLIDEKLLACANVLAPHTAIYPWQGKVETSREVPALLKGEARLHDRLEARYRELHPYEVPCLIRLQIGGINADYAAWLRDVLR